jgi:hypothetical protein
VPTADEPVKQFNVYLPTSLVRDVKLRAVTDERSLSKLTELALRAYLAHPHDPDDPEQDA